MAQPDLGTIATSAVVAAAVSGGAAFLNGWRERTFRRNSQKDDREHERAIRDADRGHEDEFRQASREHEQRLREADRTHEDLVRKADREHEIRLQELADDRALRDRKLERLRSNLVAVNSAAYAIADRAVELGQSPRRFTEQAPVLDEAIAKLTSLRSVIALDIEGSALLNAVAGLQRHYLVAVTVLNNWAEMANLGKAGNSEAAQRLPSIGKQAIEELVILRQRALAVIAQARQALETLEGVQVSPSSDSGSNSAAIPAQQPDADSANRGDPAR